MTRFSALPTVTGLVVGVLLAGVVVPLASRTDEAPASVTAPLNSASGAPASPAITTKAMAETGEPGTRAAAMTRAESAESRAHGADTAATGTPAPTDSDLAVRGVDRDRATIKIGAIIIDISQGAAVGFAVPNLSVEDIKRMYDAFVADINRRGGIGGLRVEPVYATYTDGPSARAACLQMTEDESVYVVMDTGTLDSPTALCLTQEHGQLTTLGGNTGLQGSVYERSAGLLFTPQASGQRSVRDAVRAFADKGYFDGATIGIVGDDGIDPGGEVTDALEAELRALGADVAYRSRFSGDTDTAASQAPVEVAQHRQHGVDAVVLAAQVVQVGTAFVQAAESSGWRPAYFTTDWAGYFCDTCVQLMPPGFAGAKLFTHMANALKNSGLPEPDVQRRCREVYERETGESINYRGIGLEGDAYVVMLVVCGEMMMFEHGATGALPGLDYPAFIAALERRGQSWIPPTAPGHFAPGKHDNADLLLEAEYTTDCKCWKTRSKGFDHDPSA